MELKVEGYDDVEEGTCTSRGWVGRTREMKMLNTSIVANRDYFKNVFSTKEQHQRLAPPASKTSSCSSTLLRVASLLLTAFIFFMFHSHLASNTSLISETQSHRLLQPQSHPSNGGLVAPSFSKLSNMSLYSSIDINKFLLARDEELKNAIRQVGFRIVSQSPHQAFQAFKIHSVRSGSADRLDGIGAKCDWSITWNAVLYGITATPRIVCLGTRQIEKFWKLVPALTRSRFIMVTGGGDRLQPLGNPEYPPYQGFGPPDGGPGWKMFTQSPNILHVFSENHNMNHSRYSTIPCGFPHNRAQSPTDLLRSVEKYLKPHIPFDERPIQVLVTDHIRGGEWYKDRILANEYCVNVSSSFCSTKLELDLPGGGKGLTEIQISHARFVWSVQNSQFVLCTHGGGLDPSPKAWETLFIGSIPIIQHSTLDDGYIRFPVVIVPNITEFLFNADGQSPALLERWLEERRPYFETGSALRQQVLHRLTHEYWVSVLKDKHDEVARAINAALARGEEPVY